MSQKCDLKNVPLKVLFKCEVIFKCNVSQQLKFDRKGETYSTLKLVILMFNPAHKYAIYLRNYKNVIFPFNSNKYLIKNSKYLVMIEFCLEFSY